MGHHFETKGPHYKFSGDLTVVFCCCCEHSTVQIMFLHLLVGSGDLIPVMGFFCQRCEEFFGDLNNAEKHVADHKLDEKKQVTCHSYKITSMPVTGPAVHISTIN